MRATTLLNKLLNLPGIAVRGVSLPTAAGHPLVVDVVLRRQLLTCPLCGYTTRFRYDTRPEPSWWRGLDFGTAPVIVRASLRRTRFTRDFEDLTAFLATRTDKTTIARFVRVDWDTIGRICQRVVATDLDDSRLVSPASPGEERVRARRPGQYRRR